ncbi:AraC family transcriptional regulator [uncultured Sulfitobacter sp.]|uniref:helix-turn-helix transcriptional regulator n=1 Tax=uncultured Sulfitobacter sp. TaxID=191468 RepID=UPI002605A493|nr:AraC family transcriptional regulator ligand-binding domain-containing protein [uncultured Sulfitobacter sp.]
MASVTSAFATTFARASGLDLRPDGCVLAGDRVIHSLGRQTGAKVPDSVYFDLIDWICDYCDDVTELVFQYADTFRIDDMGALGLAAKSAPTLRDTLVRLERYFRLVTDTAAYQLLEQDDPAIFVFEALTLEHPALQIRDECALAAVAKSIKAFCGPRLSLNYVCLRHRCRDNPVRLQDFFECEVRFGAEKNAIAVQRDMLELPNRLGDRGISDFLTQHLDDEIARLSNESSLKEKLIRQVSTKLSSGIPLASEVARQLGMSERTLYRRLADEGLSYRDVVQDAQSALAHELLSATSCSISEIAFLTGFSEQSTFSRAFKRWNGQAPARYRQLS